MPFFLYFYDKWHKTKEVIQAWPFQKGIKKPARRKKEGSLRPDESDRVYRISRVLDLARSVFGEKPEPLQNWFKTPKPALNGETPIDLLDTDPGVHQVRRLLNQIAYGIYT